MRKLLAAAAVIVILALVAIPVALWVLLDPEELKARAAGYVKTHTGRDLSITGPVTLSFFPWLGGTLQSVSVTAPPGFGDAPFAAIGELDVKVKVWPLLGGDIIADRVILKGARIRLETARDGRTTWDGLVGAASPPTAPTAPARDRAIRVDGVELTDGEVVWADAAGGRYEIKDVALTTGALGGREATDLALTFTLGGVDRDPVPVTLTGRLTVDAAASEIRLDDVRIPELRAFGVRVSGIQTAIAVSGGTVKVAPVSAGLYGGTYTGSLDVDARQGEPVVRLEQRLTGVDIGPLLEDLQLLGGVTGKSDLVTLNLRLRGFSMRTLAGSASVSIRDGRLEGADVLKMIEQARALAAGMRRGSQGSDAAPGSDRSPADATPFATLTATATIANGVARNTDLVLRSSALQATGSGTANLERATLDYVLRARSPQAGDLTIPIAITGPFSNLSYRVQAGALIRDAASKEIKRQIQKGLGSLFKKKPS